MKHMSVLDITQSEVVTRNVDTRLIKIRKFKEYDELGLVDFVIDGKNIRELIAIHDPSAPSITTGLQSNFINEEKIKYLHLLLGKIPADLDSGRVALYVCPQCGDLMCDAVGCRIEFSDDVITWSDFAWDGNLGNPADEDGADDEEDSKVAGLESYMFNREAYEELLNRLIKEYEASNSALI